MADPQLFTTHIDPEDCMGDSLNVINQNFLNLDVSMQEVSAASTTWVVSNSANAVTSYSWVTSHSASVSSTYAWMIDTSSLNYRVNTWTQDVSVDVNRTSTWVIGNSTAFGGLYTWVHRNSTVVGDVVNFQFYQKTAKSSVAPLSINSHKNYFDVRSVYSCMQGGLDHSFKGDYSFLGGGKANNLLGNGSIIGSGEGNKINGNYNSVLGGLTNSISGTNSFIGGGESNEIEGINNIITGGIKNVIQSDYSSIVGGFNNKAIHPDTFIVGSNITTVIPNATYVNNLVIRDTPVTDSGNGAFLLRDSNGIIRTRSVANIASIDALYTWAKQNSSSFQTTTLTQQVSTNTINYIKNSDVFTWTQSNSSSVNDLLKQNQTHPIVRRFTMILDISSSTFTTEITHDLNTPDVIIQGYNMTTGRSATFDILRMSASAVQIDFTDVVIGPHKLILIG